MSNYRGYTSPWIKSSKSESSNTSSSASKYEKCKSYAPKKLQYGGTNSNNSSFYRDNNKSAISGNIFVKSDLTNNNKNNNNNNKRSDKIDNVSPRSSTSTISNTSYNRNSSSSMIEKDNVCSKSNYNNYKNLQVPSSSLSLSLTSSSSSSLLGGTNRNYNRSSISREVSKEDLTSYRNSTTTTTMTTTTTPSTREECHNNKSYISSRFLPKNTIEKSHTAYIRPVSSRINSNQRKNREFLNLLQIQQQQRSSYSSPASSSDNTRNTRNNTTSCSNSTFSEEYVNVISRGTSPMISSTINTSNNRNSNQINNNSTETISFKNIRKKNTVLGCDVQTQTECYNLEINNQSDCYSKTPSRSSSSKSVVSNKSEKNYYSNASSNKSSDENSNSKLKKQLPPQIPIGNNSLIGKVQNKDFRKSILNMNPSSEMNKKNNKFNKRADSVSSIDSESLIENNNNSSESNTSNKSNDVNNININKKSSSSKLPTRSKNTNSSNTSSSIIPRNNSQESNCSYCSDNEKLTKSKSKSETEAKSFLLRALAPVTNFFKNKQQHDSSKTEWLIGDDDTTLRDVQSQQLFTDSNNDYEKTKIIQQEEPGHRITHIKSGEKPWWLSENNNSNSNINIINNNSNDIMTNEYSEKYKIRHIDSGERAWWLNSQENIPEGISKWEQSNKRESEDRTSCESIIDEEQNSSILLGDRASPEGVENPDEDQDPNGRLSPYDNVHVLPNIRKENRSEDVFISHHTNIDDVLGGGNYSLTPALIMDQVFYYEKNNQTNKNLLSLKDQRSSLSSQGCQNNKLDDIALQLYKDGDYGAYLDLEASISEQNEEFEGFQSNKKNSIVLRTQLSVRVHTIIEKLLTSEGRDLRRALFSLKQIFQEDKDLVHEFVQNDGLACLIKVGSEADQNYQNYILRALGQVMLYVDGMNGVIQHNETVQWLYSLISSKFRLVVKTALKLLLVFVEYTETNCMLVIKAVEMVDCCQKLPPWNNVMKLLKDFDSADTELLIYAMTLINKCFNGIPDQDTYYDQTDSLEEQGIEGIIQRYMSKPGTDLDLLQQFQIYEAVLQYEDNDEEKATPAPLRHLDESFRKTLRNRKSLVDSSERRKSRRHSTGTTPVHSALSQTLKNHLETFETNEDLEDEDEEEEVDEEIVDQIQNEYSKGVGVTPALRRRRERAERQRSFMKEQQESAAILMRRCFVTQHENADCKNYNINNNNNNSYQTSSNSLNVPYKISNGKIPTRKDTISSNYVKCSTTESEENNSSNNKNKPWILSMMYNNGKKGTNEENESGNVVENLNETERKAILQIKKENTVKDLTEKLSNHNNQTLQTTDEKLNRIGDMSGLISKAKEGLAKSKSNAALIKSPTSESSLAKNIETKKSENELRWEELAKCLDRPLNLCDVDFNDLTSEDEIDVLAPALPANGIPPPPPPLLVPNVGNAPPPPPLSNKVPPPTPAPPNAPLFSATLLRSTNHNFNNNNNNKTINNNETTKIPTSVKKNKKTVKLFWKEVRDDPITSVKLKTGLIWDELTPINVDTQKLEHLFESRAKDLITKKQQELNKNKEIIALDPKRSNAINIGMTKLPPPRSIKTAILKMDATIMNREGIEKLLTMLPTEEERTKIQEAQAANPDLPLGSAEQFLLTLASISELPARLKLWAFKLDFENTEREIVEPLIDLKQGIEILKGNKTFRGILSTLLSIGIFLNGTEVKGFQIDYLSKVPEVKDTVNKHSLLHHLCHILMEKIPDASDLYSEIGAITRASKIDFDELSLNIQRLEADCKASWDYLKLIAKHDGSTMMKVKMSDFLTDCAERIIILGIIHRRIINRFHKFLLWLGIPLHQIIETKPNEFCKIISEFALEYRTTRERVMQQLEKKANHRERNKTRGKMITEIGKFRSKEDRADAELRQLLGSEISEVESLQKTLPWRRRSKDPRPSILNHQTNGNLTDGDDEILESLVKTATKGPSSRTAPRERKRTRHADRKSLRRTLKNGLSEEEKKHLSAYIKSY